MAYLLCRRIPRGRRVDVYTGVAEAIKQSRRHLDDVVSMVECADLPDNLTAEELLAFYDKTHAVVDNRVSLEDIL